jgi:hypothetical protein
MCSPIGLGEPGDCLLVQRHTRRGLDALPRARPSDRVRHRRSLRKPTGRRLSVDNLPRIFAAPQLARREHHEGFVVDCLAKCPIPPRGLYCVCGDGRAVSSSSYSALDILPLGGVSA